ncbi:hypothetical protein Rleg2_2400 [Rhizobium leguminosarum bv. trifolii WSM2304]|uniref:SpoVT-AbrB domain-containing protein n=1 Tax=Rhizobium leguminosarum bv. trifolii (strain WSM2304) TaxID=395492 RepID=A0ABF7QNF6_RHILW|nr:hypothetical protein Rleg2_2400 [Rhizobium leguminosarum bv. trifolii WSM2304]
MTSLAVTMERQITLPPDLLTHISVRPGEKIEIEKLPGGELRVRAALPATINDFIGRHASKTKEPLTIEEMNEITASSWAGTGSDDVRGLMDPDKDRERLRDLLIEGASSEPTGPVDASYFEAVRDRALKTSR